MTRPQTIQKLLKRWRWKRYIQMVVISLAILLFMLVILGKSTGTFLGASIMIVAMFFELKPWSIDRDYVLRILNSRYPGLEYSAHLLDAEEISLTGLEHLQASLVRERFNKIKGRWNAPFQITPSLTFLIISVIMFYQPINSNTAGRREKIPMTMNRDSVKEISLNILKNEIIVSPPAYTGLPVFHSSDQQIAVPEGSNLTWVIEADKVFSEANFIINSDTIQWKVDRAQFSHDFDLSRSAIINVAVTDRDSIVFRSPLLNLTVIPDIAPEIQIQGNRELESFSWDEDKTVGVSAIARDDYGISGVDLVTTISRGSGESVKFSENRFPVSFDRTNNLYTEISFSFDLDSLDLIPGDELYYFLEVRDNRQPVPQIGRSNTYFLQVKDTSSYDYITAGELGTEVMPEYFRSQRQIIIDTEKLINDKNDLSVELFNRRSNEIAFDQKALRLRYGQFMGDENEQNSELQADNDDESEVHEEDDHDHDNEIATGNPTSSNTLEDYLHDHGDPESSSFFKVSLKAKLRAAMNEMWDAELQLRLYEPERSLPFQYRALELLREIKNDARIYVHRIGYEPPPISPGSRLSGELIDIAPTSRSTRTKEESDPWSDLQAIISSWNSNSGEPLDLNNLKKVRNTLASLAIDDPGRFYRALELSDELLRDETINYKESESLREEIINLFPEEIPPIVQPEGYPSSLYRELLQSEYD